MTPEDMPDELDEVVISESDLERRLDELAAEVADAYAGSDVVFVGVLKGAVMLMADLARRIPYSVEMDWMAVSSYGSGSQSSGVVRILKDLDADVAGRDVLVVEDVLDTGLTLSWLTRNLASRGANSVEVLTLLRKPEALRREVDVRFVGFDIANQFVVGYGLDYRQRYRNLRCVASLRPEVAAALRADVRPER